MKRFIKAGLMAVLFCFAISAQAQVKVGVKGGFNASNMSMSGFEDIEIYDQFGNMIGYQKTSYKPGFHAGLMLQVDLPGSFFLQPELLFSNQGLKEETKIEGDKETGNSTLNYLQLPIYAGYKFNAGSGLDVILGVGPYLAYGISGTDDPFKENPLIQNSDGMKMKRFDAGLSAMAGIEYNKFQITVGYDLGLVDCIGADGWSIIKDAYNLSSIYNRNVKVSIGYFF